MRAHQIMTAEVITIGTDATIVEAADRMLRHHISGLPVVDAAGHLVGIISEGDFLRRAETATQSRRGRWLSFLMGRERTVSDFVHEHGRKVGEVMTSNPLTVTEDTPLDQIAQIMETNDIKRVPVIRDQRLVGNVTRTDFLAAVAELIRHAPNPSADDQALRRAVTTAIARATWRPCRLNITVSDGIVSLRGVVKSAKARQAATVAAENVPGVCKVLDRLSEAPPYPPPEQDLGGGDFVSLQEQPSTIDDEPL